MNTESKSFTDQPYKLYFASAFGAFCLGFGDLLNNEHSATVLKISEIMTQLLQSDIGAGGLLALILLAILGVCVCWIQQPQTRLDAFSRGFSVFAVLAVATPFEPPSEKAEVALIGLANARADDPPSLRMRSLGGMEYGNIEIVIQANNADTNVTHARITLRDANTKKPVIVTKIDLLNNTLKLSRLPLGQHIMEIEIPDFRNAQVTLNINPGTQRYALSIDSSAIPAAIQRLTSAKKYTLQPLE
ncbi:MAG: hypothetical protein GXP14_05845 [Gammaproteobacteria bacterium]|nr:hypothetical protein [Gammaproteobacteria bacterium]